MGIFLDTVEDANELKGLKIDEKYRKYDLTFDKKQIPSEICPVCGENFFNDSDLQNHIFDNHREYRISQIQPKVNSSEQTTMNNLDIINSLFCELQEKIYENNSSQDLSIYKDKMLKQSDKNEKIYTEGLLEYIYGHFQESRKDYQYTSSSFAFEKAYGYLEDFARQMKINTAKQICCSIAFKMNWFEILKSLSQGLSYHSLFYLAWHFFSNPYQVVHETLLPDQVKRQQTGIIIDDFHETILEFIRLYYCDRNNITFKNLEELNFLSNNNPNYLSKLYLLRARFFREWGNITKAQENYYKIRNNNIFCAEAKSFNV